MLAVDHVDINKVGLPGIAGNGADKNIYNCMSCDMAHMTKFTFSFRDILE